MTKTSFGFCRVAFLLILGILFVFTTAFAQQDPPGKVTIHKLIRHDLSRPLRDMPPAPRQAGVKRIHPVKAIPRPFIPSRADGAAQLSAMPSINAPTVTSQ